MFEFDYQLSFSILHRDIDPARITAMLGLQPWTQSRAGHVKLSPRGEPTGRIAQMSHWHASLFEGRTLGSDSLSLSDALRECLEILGPHRLFFDELTEDGAELELRLVWVGRSMSWTGVLEADVLAGFGRLGINILLDSYECSYPGLRRDQAITPPPST